MSIALSPNMNLPVPGVGTEAGPTYGTDINNCLTILDQHTHAPGSGVLITPSAININADLPMGANNLTLARSVRFQSQVAPIATASDLGCLYEVALDLYYNDGAGNQIRITQSGSVAGSSGTITGLPSGTASAAFAAGTFTFQASTNTPANIDGGSFIFRNNTVNSKGLTLQPPNAMGADYTLTLPALPVATSFMTLDTSGNMSGAISIASGLTGSNITSNVNLAGNAVQENGKNVIVSNTNAATSLCIVRGFVTGGAAITVGEGFTIASPGTGLYTVTFTTPFASTPVVTLTATDLEVADSMIATTGAITTSTAVVVLYNTVTGVRTSNGFNFIAIGPR